MMVPRSAAAFFVRKAAWTIRQRIAVGAGATHPGSVTSMPVRPRRAACSASMQKKIESDLPDPLRARTAVPLRTFPTVKKDDDPINDNYHAKIAFPHFACKCGRERPE